MNKKKLIEKIKEQTFSRQYSDFEIEALISHASRLDVLDVENYDDFKIKKIEVTFEYE